MGKIDNIELKETFIEIRANQSNGFEKLYTKYNRLVYKIAFTILKNKEDSEDIVQTVFSKIYNLEKDKLPTDKEANWLYTLTKNEAITLLRKRKDIICLDSIYEIEDKDNEINNIIDQDEFNRLISKLNDKEKSIVSLKVLTNLSFNEIGKLLNEPTGTVKWRYYKAINTLKILLSNLGMFIITFVIGLKTTLNNQSEQESIKEENTQQDIEREETKSDVLQDDYKDISESIIDNTKENEITQETVIDSNTIQNDINYYGIGILSLSGIFLVITITFIIFLIKYQLKGNKKSSK